MARILSLVLLVIFSTVAKAQAPSNYTNINGRYRWIAGMFDSTFHIPKGTTPSLRTGGSTNSGGLFYNTSDSSVYTYTGTQWIKLRGSINPLDTTNKYVTQVYKKGGSDSVFYVRGGNHLWAFNDSSGAPGGGGGGKIYYFNGGVSMGTFGGFTMYELGDTANTGAAANFTRATNGNIANFITDPNKPGLLQIPAGVWSIDAYLSETGGGSNNAEIYVQVEKWDGSTITTIATSAIEQITNGSVIDLYTWSVSIPTTTLAVTDRIIIQFYIQNTNGKTVTLYTQNGYVGQVHTTFTTGIGAINGLTAPAQYLNTGTSGTDFNISSVTATHTFNLPTASATNRGALSSADWTTFNSKVGGSGTAGQVAYFTGSSSVGGSNNLFWDNANGRLGIGTNNPLYKTSIVTTTANDQSLRAVNSAVTGTNYAIVGIADGSGATSNIAGYFSATAATTNWGLYVQNGQSYFANNINIGTTTQSTFGLNVSGLNGIFTGGTTGGITFGTRNTGGNITLYNTTGDFRVFINSADQFVIKNNGNVLINTTTDAGFRLDVNGTARVSDLVHLNNAAGGQIRMWTSTANNSGIYGINSSSTGIYGNAHIQFDLFIRSTGSGTKKFGQSTLGNTNNICITNSNTLLEPIMITTTDNGAVGIMKSTSTIPVSAVFEIESTTKGFLQPRMTTAQRDAITSPATALAIYNTSKNTPDYYNGTNWQSVLIPNSSGNVGINTTTDAGFRLDVNGTARVQGALTVTTGGYSVTGNSTLTGDLSMPGYTINNLYGVNITNAPNGGGVTIRGTSSSNTLSLVYQESTTDVARVNWDNAQNYLHLRAIKANSTITFQAGGSNIATISSTGLGINTTTIGSGLQVNGGAAIGYSASTTAPTNGLQVAGEAIVNNLFTVTPSAANVGAIKVANFSLTGSDQTSMVSLAGTWNTTGNPTALRLNITNTASGANADLMELQVGGVNQFLVSKAGNTEMTGSIKTGAPSGGTAQAWKLGSVVASSVTYDPNNYVEVEINGSAYKLALAIPSEPEPLSSPDGYVPNYGPIPTKPVVPTTSEKVANLEKKIAELESIIQLLKSKIK